MAFAAALLLVGGAFTLDNPRIFVGFVMIAAGTHIGLGAYERRKIMVLLRRPRPAPLEDFLAARNRFVGTTSRRRRAPPIRELKA